MNCGSGWSAVRQAVLVERGMEYVDHSQDAERAGFGDPNALGHKLENLTEHKEHSEAHSPGVAGEKPTVGDKESV